MTVHAYTDGASRGNPGESGIGILAKDEEGNVLLSASGYIGRTTNNLAEYTALLALLRRAKTLNCSRLIVYSDSELMVKQMRGEYRIKNEEIRGYQEKIQRILSKSPFEFEILHIPREMNGEADALANKGIDSRKRIRV